MPPGPGIIPMKVITPYDVIDRIGLRVQVQRAIEGVEAASMAEGERIMENGVPHQSPPSSPRLGSAEEDRHPAHLGSSNPALRKKTRPNHPALMIHSASKTSSQKLGLLGSELLQNAVGVQTMQGDQKAQKICSGPRVQLHQCWTRVRRVHGVPLRTFRSLKWMC